MNDALPWLLFAGSLAGVALLGFVIGVGSGYRVGTAKALKAVAEKFTLTPKP